MIPINNVSFLWGIDIKVVFLQNNSNMKKVIIITSIIIFILTLVTAICVIVAKQSIVHVHLPHGAVLHVFPHHRDNKTDGAVIICPGGGYRYLAKRHEGYMWFPFFYFQGYTPALLEYRMPKHDSQTPLIDGTEAVNMMRKRAKVWHFNDNNIGIVGFSAGGHLASTILVTENDSARPDFGILFYPVISMKRELTHLGTHDQLLGQDASEELEHRHSNELFVTEYTPPTYIALSDDDRCVNPQNSIRFYDEMRAKNRSVILHVYPTGDHGWGYKLSFDYHRQMLKDLKEWLSKRK